MADNHGLELNPNKGLLDGVADPHGDILCGGDGSNPMAQSNHAQDATLLGHTRNDADGFETELLRGLETGQWPDENDTPNGVPMWVPNKQQKQTSFQTNASPQKRTSNGLKYTVIILGAAFAFGTTAYMLPSDGAIEPIKTYQEKWKSFVDNKIENGKGFIGLNIK